MFNPDPFSLISDPLPALSDSSIGSILQEFSEQPPNSVAATEIQNSLAEAQSLEKLPQTLISNSSPVQKMENLPRYQQTQFTNLPNSAGFESPPISNPPISNAYFTGIQSCGGESSMNRFLQRSCSHGDHLYDQNKQGSLFQPPYSAVPDSSENRFGNGELFDGQIRRVLRTGDLTKNASPTLLGSKSTTSMEEAASFKVARYSAEERKERIDRYRAKRSLRNFSKTIKYACRKTLADNRRRIRGRFARNDEPIERPKSVACLNRYKDEDEHIWVEGLHEGNIHGVVGDQRGVQFLNNFGESAQLYQEFTGY